ncbi:MAG: SBBP repeat-containing protein [Bacteroidia bacterium]
MKQLILIFIANCLAVQLFSQAPYFNWAKGIGGVEDDKGYAIITDGSGNVYTTGGFRNTVDFDAGTGTFNLTSIGAVDIFISKMDAAGNFVWAKSMGGIDYDYGQSLATDAAGNVYLTGPFYDTVDFDPGPGIFNLVSAGNRDLFILKLDAAGNFIWADRIGNFADDYAKAVITDNSGNIFITGYFTDTVDFDPGPGTFSLVSAGVSDIFILKLNTSGNFVWAKSMGGAFYDMGQSIIMEASGEFIYSTGQFMGTADFDPGTGNFNLTAAGYFDIFVLKIDTAGNFVWAKRMGGSGGDDIGVSVSTDGYGNVYTTGNFLGVADFDPGPATYTLASVDHDIFISRLDSSGNFSWAKRIGSSNWDYGNAICTDAIGNVYTTGYFHLVVDFDPGTGTFNMQSLGFEDIFISMLDSSGNFVWARRIGGTSGDEGLSITRDASGNIYTTGLYESTVDFNTDTAAIFNITSSGASDIFVHKLSPFPVGISENNQPYQFTIFPNPAQEYFDVTINSVFNKATISVINMLGEKIFENTFLHDKSQRCKITGLSQGVYFIKIILDGKEVVRKAVKY